MKMLDANSPEVIDFLDAWHENGRRQFTADFTNLDYDSYYPKTAKERSKYLACDRGSAGTFLIDRNTGAVYSIKGYGRPCRLLGGILSVTALYRAQTAAKKTIGSTGYIGEDQWIFRASAQLRAGIQTPEIPSR